MATLYVTEYDSLLTTDQGRAQIAMTPPVNEQTVTFTTSTQSTAFKPETRVIRVNTTATCSIAIGVNPTATTGKTRMAADQTEYFGVRPGDKIAAVTNT